jgi:threonine dehydratase
MPHRKPRRAAETHRLSLLRIAHAATIIDPVFLDSPQFRPESLEQRVGCRLVTKVETINPIRSFKGRGTEYLTASLSAGSHLVCATAGNFGQGMAYSGRARGLRITIFASEHANPFKIERMRALGADVRLVGEDFDAAHVAARTFATQHDARMVEDGRDPALSEGAGTIGIELLRWHEPFDAILVPLGDGALLAGVARWVKAHRPETRMIGVCASGAPAMERSWRAAEVLELERAETIADGIAVRSPFGEALADLTGLVDDILLVDDPSMVAAMRLAHQELGIVLEPAGAAGLAALLTYPERFRDQSIGTILSGGNITGQQMRQWLAP